MNANRILVAASLTNGRDAAFERGLALARASAAELYVLHAVPASQAFSVGATQRLERAAELRIRAEQAGVIVRTVVQHGDPAGIIQLHANARSVDLIVMGPDRTLGSKWLRRPSIAERVLRRTMRPTLVVPTDDDAGVFGNVLVAMDLSHASRQIMDYSVQLLGDASPRLTVVHSVGDPVSASAGQNLAWWTVPGYQASVLEGARRQLEAVVAELPHSVAARVHIATGSHAKAIVEHAEAADADLVVVGRSGSFRPLGTTALSVLRNSTRALLVVPVMKALPASETAEHCERVA